MTTKTRKVRRRASTNSKPKTTNSKLILPSEPTEPPASLYEYCLFIMGAKGVGKTTLLGSFPNSMVLQLEPRRRSARIRQYSIRPMSTLEMTKEGVGFSDTPWEQIGRFIDAAIADESIQHIGIDTADRFYDAALTHFCYKGGKDNPSEFNDYGKTWDVIKWSVEQQLCKILFADRTIGLTLLSHTRVREVAEADDPEEPEMAVPTCKPAMWTMCKGLTDYCFFYGFRGGKRMLRLRGDEERMYLSTGNDEHFLDPDSNQVKTLQMGDSAVDAAQILQDSFNNQIYDMDHVDKKTTRKPIKRS